MTDSFVAERRRRDPNFRADSLARARVLPHSQSVPAAEAAWLRRRRRERIRYWRNAVAGAGIGLADLPT